MHIIFISPKLFILLKKTLNMTWSADIETIFKENLEFFLKNIEDEEVTPCWDQFWKNIAFFLTTNLKMSTSRHEDFSSQLTITRGGKVPESTVHQ